MKFDISQIIKLVLALFDRAALIFLGTEIQKNRELKKENKELKKNEKAKKKYNNLFNDID